MTGINKIGDNIDRSFFTVEKQTQLLKDQTSQLQKQKLKIKVGNFDSEVNLQGFEKLLTKYNTMVDQHKSFFMKPDVSEAEIARIREDILKNNSGYDLKEYNMHLCLRKEPNLAKLYSAHNQTS